MIYFVHIAYCGSHYSGWQWQPNTNSIQEEIEKSLKKIFKQKITVYGCGRTDASVHASQYFFHIELKKEFDFDLVFRLNRNLPDDITVYDVIKMEGERHARFDAISRTYDYFIHFYDDPVLAQYSSFYKLKNLDVESMKKACSILTDYVDYRSFCKQPDLHNHTRCSIRNAQLFVSTDEQRMHFSITADRFLRGMIRLLVAFLLKVGKREMSFKEFEDMLANQVEIPNKMPAFPNGLYLSKIEYPYLNREAKQNMASFLKTGF